MTQITMEQQLADLQQQLAAMQADLQQQRVQSAQTVQDMTQHVERSRALETEVTRLSRENLELRGQRGAVGPEVGQMMAGMTQLMEQMRGVVNRGERDLLLVDAKGLGKPQLFNNDENKYVKWSRSVENYVIGVYGEEFRPVMDWALGCDTEVTQAMRTRAYGAEADDVDRIMDLEKKVHQVYQTLMALTEDESQDIVIGAGSGNGLEAWRKLGRRWDPVVAGRKRALLKQIISPERCKLDQLIGCWERWEEQVRRYEKRKDEAGERLRIDQETKMSAFELLLPVDLENHLILNKKRLSTYELQKEEIDGILESRLGARIRELQIKPKKDPNAMDVDGFTKGKGKGKGKGSWHTQDGKGSKGNGKGDGKGQGGKPGRFNGNCYNCGKQGHAAKDCWSRSSGKAKGKGKKGKTAVGSLDTQGQEVQGGMAQAPAGVEAVASLDVGALDQTAVKEAVNLMALTGLAGAAAGTGQWIKMNYDTGAAVTAFPQEYAPGVRGNGQRYRTATGEYTEDCGELKLTAELENGNPGRISGRLAAVHKVLVSASRCAGFGMNGWICKGGGYLVPEGSEVAKKIHALVEKESWRNGNGMIPLYEEAGVYNFYVKAGTNKGKVEIIGETDLQSMTREDLEKEVAAMRARSGFSRQP